MLATSYKGEQLISIDNFDVAKDGKVYFSDASSKYGIDRFMLDVLEGKPYGRLFVWDPQTNEVTLLIDGLYFANGVEVAPDQQSVFLSETNAARILEYFLSGPKKGKYEVVVENLPGFPDNIKFNEKGELWVAIPSFRDVIS